jgi:hypothetical protein
VAETVLVFVSGPGASSALIPLEDWKAGVARAAALLAASTTATAGAAAPLEPQLVDSVQFAAQTSTPASRWESLAARNLIPHYRIGRYVRFAPAEVLAASRRDGNRTTIGGGADDKAAVQLPPSRRERMQSAARTVVAIRPQVLK